MASVLHDWSVDRGGIQAMLSRPDFILFCEQHSLVAALVVAFRYVDVASDGSSAHCIDTISWTADGFDLESSREISTLAELLGN